MKNRKLFSMDISMVENGYIVREDFNRNDRMCVPTVGTTRVFESLKTLIEFLEKEFDVDKDKSV